MSRRKEIERKKALMAEWKKGKKSKKKSEKKEKKREKKIIKKKD